MLGSFIRQVRQSKKPEISISTLANRVGVTTSTIGSIERNERGMRFDILLAVFQALGIKLEVSYENGLH